VITCDDQLTCAQCDEEKPKCTRCEKGGRECKYPPPLIKLKKSNSKIKADSPPERRASFGSSDSDESLEFSEDEFDASPIVRFSSASSFESPPPKSPREPVFTGLPLYHDLSAENLDLARDLSEPLFHASTSTIALSEPSLSPKQFPETTFFREPDYSEKDTSPGFICIPHCISPVQQDFSKIFYLDYHRENITEFHYFRYYDHHKYNINILFQMADNSVALFHAIVAFSALLYSMNNQGSPGEDAFEYYDSSLREFRRLLEMPLLDDEDIHVAIATALQLSSFDVSTLQ
jgi:Fungal specific transcription factor domain